MRIFNKSLNYTLKAILFLANHSVDGLVLASEISKSEKIPYHYLAKILQRLTRFRFIESVKGRNGGFQITEKGLNSTVSVIIKTVDGPSPKDECILGKPECSAKSPCEMHRYWNKIRDDINSSLLQAKIRDLITKK